MSNAPDQEVEYDAYPDGVEDEEDYDDDDEDEEEEMEPLVDETVQPVPLEEDDGDDDKAKPTKKPRTASKANANDNSTSAAWPALEKLLVDQRIIFAAKYTPDTVNYTKVRAVQFAQRGIVLETLCIVCGTSIMGNCTQAYELALAAGKKYVHGECMTCTNQTHERRCSHAPFVPREKDSKCYVDALDNGMPVCVRHLTLLHLRVPKFEVKDKAAIQTFVDNHGFAIIRTGATPEYCAAKADWIERVIGTLAGWTDAQRREYLAQPGADWRLKIPGISMGLIGVTGPAPGDKNQMAAVLQGDEIWNMRAKAFPACLNLFPPRLNIVAGMCPILALFNDSKLQRQEARSACADKRHTEQREHAKGRGRATAQRICNGYFVVTPCTAISVLVCPPAWETDEGQFTFEQEWNKGQRRQYPGGIFPPRHPVAGLMVPLVLDAGDVVVWKNTRAYRLIPDKGRNVYGIAINARDSLPKEITMRNAAATVIAGIVIGKQPAQMGWRYLRQTGPIPELPSGLGDVNTPLTNFTVGRYAECLFGTKKKDPAHWPPEFQASSALVTIDRKMSSSDEARRGGGGGEEEDDDLLLASSIRTIPEASASAKKKRERAPPKPVAADEDNDEEDDMDPLVDEEAGESAPRRKPAAAKKAKPAAERLPAGNPCIDPADTIKSADAGRLPKQLRFDPTWLPAEDDEQCLDKWTSLLQSKVTAEVEVALYNGDRLPTGCVAVLGPVRLELFDAFNDAKLGPGLEAQLADYVTELGKRERKPMRIGKNEVVEARVVEVFGQPVKYGAGTHKPPANEPQFVRPLLEALSTLPPPTIADDADGELRPTTTFNRLMALCVTARTETLNAIQLLDVVPAPGKCDADVVVLCVGGMQRRIRIRSIGVKLPGMKSRPKGTILADFIAYSGLGVLLPASFFGAATIEAIAVSGPKDTQADPTAPFALFVASRVTAAVKARPAAAPSMANARASVAANNAAASAPTRKDLEALLAAHGARIKADPVLLDKKQEAMTCLGAVNKGGSAAAVREFVVAVAALHEALTGEEYVPSEAEAVVVAPKAPKKVAPRPGAPATATAAAPAPASAKKVKTATADPEEFEEGLFDVPDTTRRVVKTSSGKTAVRSTRKAAPVTSSKQDEIRKGSDDLMREGYERNEKKRMAKFGLRYVRQSYAQYCRQMESGGKEAAAKDKDADFNTAVDALGGSDLDDGSFHSGEELAHPMDEDDDDDDEGGSSESGSDDDDDEDQDAQPEDPKAAAANKLALRFDKLQGLFDVLYTLHKAVLDGKQPDKELKALYESANESVIECEKRLTERKLAVFEERYELLKAALAAKLPAAPPAKTKAAATVPTRKRPAPAPHAPHHAVESEVVEGFNPGVDPMVTAALLDSLIEVTLGFLGELHHIPHVITDQNLEGLRIAAQRCMEGFGDSDKAVNVRINADTLKKWEAIARALNKVLANAKKVPAPTPVVAAAAAAEPMEESDAEEPALPEEDEEAAGENSNSAVVEAPEEDDVDIVEEEEEQEAPVVAVKPAPPVAASEKLYAFMYKAPNSEAIIYKIDTTEEGVKRQGQETLVGAENDAASNYYVKEVPANWKAKLAKLGQQPNARHLAGKKESAIWDN